MSVQALSAVLEESQARLGARLVLIAIANHANEKGENSYPNLETLAREARLSVRQVQRCIDTLTNMGELVAKTRFETSNLYRIVLPTLVKNSVGQIVTPDKSGPEMSLQPSGTGSSSLSDKKSNPKFNICEFCGLAVVLGDEEAHECLETGTA